LPETRETAEQRYVSGVRVSCMVGNAIEDQEGSASSRIPSADDSRSRSIPKSADVVEISIQWADGSQHESAPRHLGRIPQGHELVELLIDLCRVLQRGVDLGKCRKSGRIADRDDGIELGCGARSGHGIGDSQQLHDHVTSNSG
jgi:hypothetical protein